LEPIHPMVLAVVKETDDTLISDKKDFLCPISLSNFTGSTLRSLRLLGNEEACRLEQNAVMQGNIVAAPDCIASAQTAQSTSPPTALLFVSRCRLSDRVENSFPVLL
jgi:hypothetical protein